MKLVLVLSLIIMGCSQSSRTTPQSHKLKPHPTSPESKSCPYLNLEGTLKKTAVRGFLAAKKCNLTLSDLDKALDMAD